MRPLARITGLLWLPVFLFLCLAVSTAWASEDQLFREAEKARQGFEADKKAQNLRHEWLNVLELYKRIIKEHPQGEHTQEALMAIGDLYVGLYRRSRQTSDLDKAVEHYLKLTKGFPQGKAAPEAQLKLGQVYYWYKKDPDRAYVELLKVELNHPGSKTEAAEARKLMAEISKSSQAPAPEIERPEKDAPPPPPSPSQGPKAQVRALRNWHNPTYSRVAIDLDRPVKFEGHLLRPNPELKLPMRLYVDIQDSVVSPDIREELPIGDGMLKKARVAQFTTDTVRLVLDIENITDYRIFSLSDPFRIVVDVAGGRKDNDLPAETKPRPPVEDKEPVQVAPEPERPREPLVDLTPTAKKRKKLPRGPARGSPDQASLARQLGLGIKRVVIDPGHGGKDRGAEGITGLHEKDLTLRVALMLAEKIEKQLGLEVFLTRNKDVFLPLEERTAIANTKVADLFISIHANAHKSGDICGLETYFLNLATDKEAMLVAARENATSTKNMSDLQIILSDLMLNSKIAESGRLSNKIHQSMITQLRKNYRTVRDLGVKQAPFYVLIGANMPSILLELGFISNKVEEKRLQDKGYLDCLTDGIIEGIKTYQASVKKAG
ncbi:MAG: N-acetylmuramoyl-L-alanine amidase [Pseudomonadota bacterium]